MQAKRLTERCTVDRYDCASNVARKFARKKQKNIRDFCGFSDTAERDTGGYSCDHVVWQCGDHVGFCNARRDGIDADICLLYTSPSPRDP